MEEVTFEEGTALGDLEESIPGVGKSDSPLRGELHPELESALTQ